MAVTLSPWMGEVTLASKQTVYNLYTLLAAKADAVSQKFGNSKACQWVSIQLDPMAGSTQLSIGQPGMAWSSTRFTDAGVVIFASQTWPIYSVETNLIRLDQITLGTDTDNTLCHVQFLVR